MPPNPAIWTSAQDRRPEVRADPATSKWTGAETKPVIVERPGTSSWTWATCATSPSRSRQRQREGCSRAIGYATQDIRTDSYDKTHVWVRVDGNALNTD
jgi:hypothetical protein